MAFLEKEFLITDVAFLYTKVKNHVPKKDARNEKTEREYVVDLAMNKETAQALKGKFNRQLKVIENDDFERIFKIESPFPEQPMQYVMKIATNAFINDKEIGYDDAIRPKVWDVDGNDITNTLIANGSKGDVHFSTVSGKGTNKPSLFLRNMLVKELIVWEGAEEGEGVTQETANPFAKKQDAEPAKEVKAKNTEPTEDDDCPFL